MKIKNRKRLHHELPEYYLRGFCDGDSSFLWIYNRKREYSPGLIKGKNNPYRSGIHTTTRKKDLYSVITPKGEKLFSEYEDKLQTEEQKVDELIRKIRNKEKITPQEKEQFARYIQLMMKRVTQRTKSAINILDKELQSTQWQSLIFRLASMGRFDLARQAYDAKKYLESPEAGKKYLVVETMLRILPKLHKCLLEMNWTFCIAPPGKYFLTSSNPVVFDESAGIRNSPIVFPISKEVVLLAKHNRDLSEDLETKLMTEEEVDMINYDIITSSTEIISPKSEKWVNDIYLDGMRFTEEHSKAFIRLFS